MEHHHHHDAMQGWKLRRSMRRLRLRRRMRCTCRDIFAREMLRDLLLLENKPQRHLWNIRRR
jgi:hypothetical protein